MTTSVSVFEPHTQQQAYQRQPLFCVGSPDERQHDHSHSHEHSHEHSHSHSHRAPHSHSHGHSHSHAHEHEHAPGARSISVPIGGRPGSTSSDMDADGDDVEEADEDFGNDQLTENSRLLGTSGDSQRRVRRALRRRGYSYCSNYFTQRFVA